MARYLSRPIKTVLVRALRLIGNTGTTARHQRSSRSALIFKTSATGPQGAINLALQGGGAHGAYTWGVLEALSDVKGLHIDAISGASAGAMNAVVFANGYARGGPVLAASALHDFWQDVSQSSRSIFSNDSHSEASVLRGIETVTRFASPYQFNPLGYNPMRALLEKHVDFDLFRRPDAISLFIAATNVATGECRIFTNAELTVDVVLASACLPQFHQAVEINNEHYWDGGFSSNPPILPLLEQSHARDTIVVQIIPNRESGVPTDVRGIVARHSRMAFTSPLRREIREIRRLQSLARDGFSVGGHMRSRTTNHRFHLINAPDLTAKFGKTSAINPNWQRLQLMHESGYDDAGDWLFEHGPFVGRKSTVDLSSAFLPDDEERLDAGFEAAPRKGARDERSLRGAWHRAKMAVGSD
ncbi:MAG: patatin-like phospholipase family protein [Pseudomonadota bacterium]